MKKTSPSDILAGCFVAAIAVVVIVAGSAILNGWVLSILWGWFLTNPFELPHLSITHAIGISLIAGMLQHPHMSDENESQKTKYNRLGFLFLRPLMALLVGWIVTWFM